MVYGQSGMGLWKSAITRLFLGLGYQGTRVSFQDNESYGLFCCAMLLRITGPRSAAAGIPAAPLSALVD